VPPRIRLAGLLLPLLLPWAARAADSMPRYDPIQACTDAARRAGARDSAAPPDCVKGETEARDEVTRAWPGLSDSGRSRCTRLADRRQSFLILGSCVEREATTQR
jgi:hypothetical protein